MLRRFHLLLFVACGLPLSLPAQEDSLSLLCPLPNGTPRIVRASDRSYERTSEYGVVFTSKTDTLVRACHEGQVVIVALTELPAYDIVIFYKGYYFWYSGVQSPRVSKGSRVKAGDEIGKYVPGDMMELLVFFEDEPFNPRRYLKCN